MELKDIGSKEYEDLGEDPIVFFTGYHCLFNIRRSRS